MSKTSRSRRTLTTRDMVVLSGCGRQYAYSFRVLQAELGKTNPNVHGFLSRWGTRNQVGRWQEQRLVKVEHLLGQTWVTPSEEGRRRLGLPYPVWPMPLTRLAHVDAVNVVRLWREVTSPASEHVWVSERDLVAERGRDASWHIGDAALIQGASGADQGRGTGADEHWLVEVELTPKARARYVSEVFESLRPTVSGLVYFVPEPLLGRIRSDVTTAQREARHGHDVRLSFRSLPTLDDVERALIGGE